MTHQTSVSVLFTGYAPVHFLCFQPLYERLVQLPGVEVFVSGGRRTKTDAGYGYDSEHMYAPFGIPEHRRLTVDDIQHRQFDVLFSANKRIITPPEHIGTHIQIFHGVSFRNRAVRPENLAYDVLFLIGPYMRQKFIGTGLLAEGDPRAVNVGFPKTDALLTGAFKHHELLARYGCDGTRPILLYAPTGEPHNSLETMGKEVLHALAKTGRYDLLIKPHDHPANAAINWFDELAGVEGPRTRVVRDLDVIPLLALADLLITDASSVANEFALLNRPIVYLDVPELIQASVNKGACVDLETWGRRAGVVVKAPEDVPQAVASSLAAPGHLAEMRAAIARNLFYNPGCATDAAIAWFVNRFLNP
ncbi:CDP-glycerol glycerophosphotransferase family protein [Candidatus Entotheonella palauensis]|uniref:CDP-glycerol glycerophosphotransferase family protein n=1 Tax=Candidatus Entotheonella palauensis TaxID=93172 RepID=UPI000B7DBC88|nr:CDP-glycerol glycerophosphotransferase family protein [Candidatus Entotheonella palauensis]